MSIGLEIAIVKVSENESTAVYDFSVGPDRGGLAVERPCGRAGRVEIRKADGQVMVQLPCPDDSHGMLSGRVAYKLRKHWQEGDFPDRTSWAA